MCLALAGEVLSVDERAGTAVVETEGRLRKVSLAPIVLDGGRVSPGEWVVIHTGLAVAVVGEAEARELMEIER